MVNHHFAVAVVFDANHASAVRTRLHVYTNDEIDACSRPVGVSVGSEPSDFMAVFEVVDRHFTARKFITVSECFASGIQIGYIEILFIRGKADR